MSDSRTQFTFYESFFKAMARIRKDADRAKAYDAICRFALYGEEANMEHLPDAAAVAYEIAAPVLEASRRKSKAGKKGGEAKTAEAKASKPEANESKAEANAKQVQVQEQVKEQVKEQMLITTTPPNGVVVVTDEPTTTRSTGAVAVYMDSISVTPSPASMQELMEFERELGTEVCVKAIEAAQDANVRNWRYVKAVLSSYRDRGITNMAKWREAEANRQERNAWRQKQKPGEPTVTTSDVDRMFLEAAAANAEVAVDG